MDIHPSMYQYFLGLALPEPESSFFARIKTSFQPNRPLSSPPHLTLKPPFEFPNFQRLDGLLTRWSNHQVPFSTKLERIGSFRQKKYGTVFLEPTKGEPFKHLVNSLNDFLIELEPTTNFHPHLTLAQKVPHDKLAETKAKLRGLQVTFEWHVDAVTLFRRAPGETWEPYRSYAFASGTESV